MENNSVEIIDDLTVKSPLPIGKRDENNDNSRLRIESIKKLNDADNNDDKENASDRTNIENKNKELNRIKNANRNEKVEENDNINGNDNESNENGMMKAILNSGISGTIKTNLYNSSAYIERTIDDGPEEEGDDSVFEACPNDTNANKKTPPGIFSLRSYNTCIRWLIYTYLNMQFAHFIFHFPAKTSLF